MRPMLHNAIINAGTRREAPDRNTESLEKTDNQRRSREATKAKLVASWFMSF